MAFYLRSGKSCVTVYVLVKTSRLCGHGECKYICNPLHMEMNRGGDCHLCRRPNVAHPYEIDGLVTVNEQDSTNCLTRTKTMPMLKKLHRHNLRCLRPEAVCLPHKSVIVSTERNIPGSRRASQSAETA